MAKFNFGKYAVVDPIEYHFELMPDWVWKIKPPTSGDELAMQKFMAYNRFEVGADGVRREFPPTTSEVAHREIALTFAGTNIPSDVGKPVEDGGEPVLKSSATVSEIEAVLRQMPPQMVNEIWLAIGDAVPGWGALRPKAPSSSES